MQHQARAGNTRLALVVENRECRAIHGGIDVGVFKHYIGALAAEFELNAFEIAGRSLNDLAACHC